jgi:hypothetical protein
MGSFSGPAWSEKEDSGRDDRRNGNPAQDFHGITLTLNTGNIEIPKARIAPEHEDQRMMRGSRTHIGSWGCVYAT